MIDRDIQYFLAIARERTLVRAAEQLGMGQPALSRAVARLEACYRLRLLERTARGIVLSEAGERLAARAAAAAAIAADTQAELSDMASGSRGVVRLGAGHTVSDPVVRALVPRLQNERPAAVLRIDTGFNDQLLPLLEEGTYDFVVSAIPRTSPASLMSKLLFVDELAPICRVGHPLASKRRLKVDDLFAFPWAGAGRQAVAQRLLKEAVEAAGYHLPPQQITTNSWNALLTVIARTDCISFGSKAQVDDRLARAHVVTRLDVPKLVLKRRIAIAWRQGGYLSPLVQRAIELVEQAMMRKPADV